MTKLEQLARIKLYGTRYELAVVKGDCKYLISYVIRRSRPGMMDAIRKYGQQVIDVCGIDQSQIMGWVPSRHVFEIGNGWELRLTGRTQREAIMDDELMFILDAHKLWKFSTQEVTA